MLVSQTNASARNRHVWSIPAVEVAMLFLLLLGVSASSVAWNFARQGPNARIATTEASRGTIEQGVISYQLTTGAYPATLNQLVPNDLTTLPLDGWQRPFIYTLTPNGPTPFDLRSAGPDGVAGTADDI